MANLHHKALQSALEWYLDHGVDQPVLDQASDRRKSADLPLDFKIPEPSQTKLQSAHEMPAHKTLGHSDAKAKAIELASEAATLEELRAAIEDFDALAIKKTATSLVFSDGNPESPIMLIGEAPGTEEDRQGKPFIGPNGQFLDKVLKSIDLDRTDPSPENSIYISNILNWRPPGNRSPSQTEIDVSLPFIEKHIMLVKPKILILCGGIPVKALLQKDKNISRLRKTWHEYRPATQELDYDGPAIPTLATYHPAFLLKTPAQKHAIWSDMLDLLHKLKDLNIR